MTDQEKTMEHTASQTTTDDFIRLKAAAEGGDVNAMEKLADRYLYGDGTDCNPEDAELWLRKLDDYWGEKFLKTGEMEAGDSQRVVLGNLTLALCNRKQYEAAREANKKQRQVVKLMRAHEDTDDVRRKLGYVYIQSALVSEIEKKPAEEIPWLKKALGIFLPIYQKHKTKFWMTDVNTAYQYLKDACTELGNKEEAIDWQEKSIAIRMETDAAEMSKSERISLAADCHSCAFACSKTDRRQDAIDYYEKAVELRERILAEKGGSSALRKNLSGSCHNLAGLYRKKKQWETAEMYYRRAIELREALLAEDATEAVKKSLAYSYHFLGMVLHSEERFEDAELAFQKAIGLREDLYFHMGVNSVRADLSATYRRATLNSCSLKLFGEARSRLKNLLS
ncbi:MAG: tetratricopeptide repeat protein [Clostridiales bacterium]|nr:tetratricopeptide repeat protein [Clostridiales bacterium]